MNARGDGHRPRNLLRRFWRPDVTAEVDDEIRFHIDERIRDLVARGIVRARAVEQAEREFGDRGVIREQMVSIDTDRERTTHRREYFAEFRQDVRFSLRGLGRSPAFSAMAIACVALGVCVSTTIFGAVNAILLRPLPFNHAEQLVTIFAQNPDHGISGSNISWPDYVSWRDNSRSFSGMGIWTWSSLALSGSEGEAERVEAADVSASVFPLLGVTPLLGRTFTPNVVLNGNDLVIVLSFDLWKRRYAADSSIVNRSITVDAKQYTVIGVMPPHFNFPDRGMAWRPFTVIPEQEEHGNRGYAAAIARLKPNVSLVEARADLQRVSRVLETDFPADNRGWSAQLVDMRDDVTGELQRPLMLFLVAVGFVLLIACANVANLMLARGASRQQETAVRMALGAGRARIVRAVLTESLLLSLAGGLLGLLLARGGLQLFNRAFPDGTPYYFSFSIDLPVVLFALGLTTLTALLFGLLPALGATQFDLQSCLRNGSRGTRMRGSARRVLIVGEVALSAVLLIGALLLVRSNRALLATDFGFNRHNVLTAQFTMPEPRYPGYEVRRQFADRLLSQIAALPGVTSVGTARGIPLSGWNVQGEMSVEGKPGRRPGNELIVHFQGVSPSYFRTIETPLLQGRMLLPTDRDTLHQVAVINESFAKLEFADVNPIGRRVKSGSIDENHPWVTIVGVVKDVRQYRLPQQMGPAIYYSQEMFPTSTQTLVVRTSGDPLATVPAVRRILKSLDASIPLYRVQSLEEAVNRSLWRQQLQGQVLVIFSIMAVVLAAVGLYGVIAWSVTQRTREVGIRMALGSTGGSAAGLILTESMQLACVGIVIGVAGALAMARFLASLLYKVSPFDPVAFLSVPLILAFVAVAASWIPARRAARIDPSVAMRAE